jgi:phage-related protein
VIYREADGRVPLLEWLAGLPGRARDKCVIRIERLAELGYELRRPEADYLRDDIYELRAKHRGVNYRLLYFFHGEEAAILSHGLVKQQAEVPSKEIALAIRRRERFLENPASHSYEELA